MNEPMNEWGRTKNRGIEISNTTWFFSFLVVILAVPKEELQTWLICAHEEKMTGGDYVFLYVNPEEPTDDVIDSITSWNTADEESKKAEKGFDNLLVVRSLPVLVVRSLPSSTWVKNEMWQGHFKSCRNLTWPFDIHCRKWRQGLKSDMRT